MQVSSEPQVTTEPTWPTQPGPFLFVIEVSGPLERQLLTDWVEKHRPSDLQPGAVQIAELPTTRRSAGRRRRDPALSAFLHGDEDSLVVPLRVVWLASKRGGKRSVGWIDLLKLGDPRDPDPIRQYVINRLAQDRVRIVRGEPERSSVLRQTWATEEALLEGRSFVEEVAHRAWLTLERAERRLRGSRYKVPKFPRENLTRSREFQAGVASLARTSGVSFTRMQSKTRRYVTEIAATHSPYVIDLVTGGFRWLIGRAYDDLNYEPEELQALYQMAQRHPLVFLPTHKSHFDHQSVQIALYENGLPPNHTAGGINMNFFPVGPLIRRSGVFFIRREFKDNEPYKFVLRRYIDYLLRRRFPLEWYIEGGRSRTGKLLPPRLGMLAYVVESYLRGSTEDVIFIPVSIAYDQIADVHSYAAEQMGAPKRPETFSWMMRMIRGLQEPYGAIHIRLGAPISLRNFLDDLGEAPTDADDTRSPAIPKLAFEISNRINEATPVTPVSLIAMTLLDDRANTMTCDEIVEAVKPFSTYVGKRQVPTTTDLSDPSVIVDALGELATHSIVEMAETERGTAYRIPEGALLAAAYYRNTVIHHFLNGAIAELALAAAAEASQPGRERFLAEARDIRDLLLFDFFFPGRSDFDDTMLAEVAARSGEWRSDLEQGAWGKLLACCEPRLSPPVLLSFLDAYRIVGDVLGEHTDESNLTERTDDIVAAAMDMGRRYKVDGTIRSAESISKALFTSALKSADHQNAGASVVDAATFTERAHRLAGLAHDLVTDDRH